jgi:hypothetical protein
MSSIIPPLRLLAGVVSATALVAGSSNLLGQTGPSPAQPALRLVLECVTEKGDDGDVGLTFSLLDAIELREVLPPPDELPAVRIPPISIAAEDLAATRPVQAGHVASGFWYELVTDDGAVLYRRITENPILLWFEGIDPQDSDAAPRLTRVESIPARRVFSLLVPDLLPSGPDRFVVLIGSPPGQPAAPATELGRVRLPGSIVIASIRED